MYIENDGTRQSNTTTSDIAEAFTTAMASAGVHLDRGSARGPHPIADGKLHRADATGKKVKKNGHIWYVLHTDDVAAGAFGDLAAGIEDTWCAKKPSSMTDEERRALKDRMKETQRLRAEELAEMQAAAREAAAVIMKATGKASPDHAYLSRKGLPVFAGLRVIKENVRYSLPGDEKPRVAYAGNLVVPMFTPQGELVGIQMIHPDGKKLFLKGTAKDGNYHSIGKAPGEPDGIILIAEGYATAARVHAATGYLTIAAFDSGNLLSVAKAIRSKYPGARIVFAADNDRMTVRPIENPGVHFAKAAAAAVSGRVSIPVFEDGDITSTDFDDLAQIAGIEKVRETIEATINPKADIVDLGLEREKRRQDEAPPQDNYSGAGRTNPAPVPLGHDEGLFFYWIPGQGQVKALSAAAHTSTALIGLAPLTYWEMEHAGRKGVDWTAAANDLIRECEARGVFDPSRKVGRGVLSDRGRVVAHLGNRLMVDGVEQPLSLPKSKWIYVQRPEIETDDAASLSGERGKAFITLMERLPWAQKDMGRLLAGWFAIAGICGFLKWRPHIWINGERGSGKSYIMESIARRALGDFAVEVQGETTEAGVRQALRGDILPVLFDEIEGKGTDDDTRRVQKVLALARQASSANGAAIVKGTTAGGAMSFRVRSSFLFASIEKSGTHPADESRLITLNLIRPGDMETADELVMRSENFERLRSDFDELLTADFAASLLLRSIRLAETINKNAEIFAQAIAKKTGNRRLGDTLGQPLAGWLSLQTDSLISPETATKRLSTWSWLDGALARGKTEADHDAALEHLMQSSISLDKGVNRPIGELVADVAARQREWKRDAGPQDKYSPDAYEQALNRAGVRVSLSESRAEISVAAKHPKLDDLFRGQSFTVKTLFQHPGAKRSAVPIRFAGGVKVWAIQLEIDVEDEDGSEKPGQTSEVGQPPDPGEDFDFPL